MFDFACMVRICFSLPPSVIQSPVPSRISSLRGWGGGTSRDRVSACAGSQARALPAHRASLQSLLAGPTVLDKLWVTGLLLFICDLQKEEAGSGTPSTQ